MDELGPANEIATVAQTREEKRLAALADYEILDTTTEKIFDSITSLATQVCDVPISMIVFLDRDRQWFKSIHGAPEELKDIKETSRDIAFCNATILQTDVLEIKDLTADNRFSNNPFVTNYPNIRYYAGVPLANDDGLAVGTLCLLDQKPHALDPRQKEGLRYLSRIVVALLEARKNVGQNAVLGKVLETSFNEIYLFDIPDLNCVYANTWAAHNLRCEMLEILNKNFNEIFYLTPEQRFNDCLQSLLKKDNHFSLLESQVKRADGSIYPAELRLQISFDKKNPILIIAADDITERKIAEENLKEANRTLETRVQERTREVVHSLALIKATLQSTTDAILVVDNKNRLTDYNQKLSRYFGSGILTQRIDPLIFLQNLMDEPKIFEQYLSEIEKYPQNTLSAELALKTGEIFEFNSQPQVVDEIITGRVWSFREITSQKRLQDQLIRQATHDPLTDLPNRMVIEDRISQAIYSADTAGSAAALLFVDLDRFKSINDTFGHGVGDELLKQVSAAVKKIIRPSDSLGRIGGDEFIILVTPIKDTHEVYKICEQLLQLFSTNFRIDNKLIKTTASIGISLCPKDGKDVETLLRNADIAMYRSKEIGRNTFHFYTEDLNAQVVKRLVIENYLKEALSKNELRLSYQPLLDLKTKKICGVEALIRWHQPVLGDVSPVDFIPIAEETGAIFQIGEWIMRTACTEVKKWHTEMQSTQFKLAVNVSAPQFKHEKFIEQVRSILDDTGFTPASLELELTESIMLDEVDKALAKMRHLKALGIALVMDDFGTGYSSLSYLQNLPLSKLKIDRSFVITICDRSKSTAILLAIIAMAKSLEITVLAEGVENVEQYEFLDKHGCNQLQGHYISAAREAAACLPFIENYKEQIKP